MTVGDVIGVLSVYAYVIILLLITEKVIKDNQLLSRKILHIGVGNIIFILPIFDTRWVMAFIAAAPFILLTFLLSPYSPIKITTSTSSKGHRLGLVYYAISWTVLAFLFFEQLEIIAIGIVAMSYGDGFASLIGIKYGKRKYNILGDEKSIEGSIAMFIFSILIFIVALIYYSTIPSNLLFILPTVALSATIAEAVTSKGLDNLSVSLTAAFFYYLLVYIINF